MSHPYFFPIYAAAEKAELAFCVHTSTGNFDWVQMFDGARIKKNPNPIGVVYVCFVQPFGFFLGLLIGAIHLSAAIGLAQEKVRIAPSSPGLSAWPVHLAVKEGFFAQEGFSAEIIVMRTNTGIAALVTGSVDFTTAGGSAMRAAANGAPIKMVLNGNKKADLWILAK